MGPDMLMPIGILMVIAASILAAMGYRGREQVVGIDLGTTFSVASIKRGKEVTIIPDYVTGKVLVPSVVHYSSDRTVVVGDGAVALRSAHPNQTIFNAKRFIGRNMSEVSADAAAHPYQVVGNQSQDPATSPDLLAAGFAVMQDDWLGGRPVQRARWVSPIDVGAEVVAHIKRSVSHFVGYEMSRAVICVPAKFSAKETKATVQAFEKAGFKVQRVLEEPTAAAIAYNLHKVTATKHVLVYDIGGGTLDTSLLYMNGRSVSVLGVAGDDHLGGSDFDLGMREVLLAKLPSAERLAEASASTVGCDSTGLLVAAERIKIALSSAESAEALCLAEGGGARRIVVTRAEFEQGCKALFDRALAPVEQVLTDQMMTPANVDDVVLVGGASRMPFLRQLIQNYIGHDKKLHTEIDPDVTVAYGAANILD